MLLSIAAAPSSSSSSCAAIDASRGQKHHHPRLLSHQYLLPMQHFTYCNNQAHARPSTTSFPNILNRVSGSLMSFSFENKAFYICSPQYLLHMQHFTYYHNNQDFARPTTRIFQKIFNRVSSSLTSFGFENRCLLSCNQSSYSVRRSAKSSFAVWPQPGNSIQPRSSKSICRRDSLKLVKRATSSEEMESETSKGFDEFLEVANRLADAAAGITLKYFRTPIDIIEKLDKSPVTVADQAAEKAMRLIIAQHFPSHAIYGEEGGLTSPEYAAEYTWVLDPIDGTKSFVTGKPLFGTLIALVEGGIPILGIIDQPVLKERWIGQRGQPTTLNGKEVKTRSCTSLSNAYMYTTSPHLFAGQAEVAYERLRKKVKVPLYGCDCYAYGLLAAGHVDLVVESGLKPYDYLALVPVVEGSGGIITNWNGQSVRWWPSMEPTEMAADIIAAGAGDALEIITKR